MPTYYTVIAPLRFPKNLLAITDPLSLETWICFLVSIPAFVGVMCLMNYLFSGYANWEESGGFVLRNVFRAQYANMPDKTLYQKLLVIVWAWIMMVLISAYAGELTAFIAKPALNIPFTTVEGLVKQTQVKWGVLGGSPLTQYAESQPRGTVMRTMIDHAITFSYDEEWADDCFTSSAEKSGDIASLCDTTGAIFALSNKFSKTGTCDYFLTEDKILAFNNVLAFQVRTEYRRTIIYTKKVHCHEYISRKEASSWMMQMI